MARVTVNYDQDLTSGDAVVSCLECGRSALLLVAADDSEMSAFVTEHMACEAQTDGTCDSCRGSHVCWTCEDEGNCHAAAVRAARVAAGSHGGPAA